MAGGGMGGKRGIRLHWNEGEESQCSRWRASHGHVFPPLTEKAVSRWATVGRPSRAIYEQRSSTRTSAIKKVTASRNENDRRFRTATKAVAGIAASTRYLADSSRQLL